jgi:hypothetical protein
MKNNAYQSMDYCHFERRILMNEYKELKDIVEQLELCNYECEAGKLENNTAFVLLKELSKRTSCFSKIRDINNGEPMYH